jgi:hypothetical protein
MQRLRLSAQLGAGLTGSLYVLDEPTIGLHPRDTDRLLDQLASAGGPWLDGDGDRARRGDDSCGGLSARLGPIGRQTWRRDHRPRPGCRSAQASTLLRRRKPWQSRLHARPQRPVSESDADTARRFGPQLEECDTKAASGHASTSSLESVDRARARSCKKCCIRRCDWRWVWPASRRSDRPNSTGRKPSSAHFWSISRRSDALRDRCPRRSYRCGTKFAVFMQDCRNRRCAALRRAASRSTQRAEDVVQPAKAKACRSARCRFSPT